mgnify:CR=1 FL=1
MAIPKYFEMYRAFLECLQDGNVHTMKDVKLHVIETFLLSDEDLAEMLPSGKQGVFDNRIGWCRTYLKKAALITSPARAQFIITDDGKKLISNPGDINDDTLMQFPEFVKFKKGESTDTGEDAEEIVKVQVDETPQEILDRAHKELNNALANELLSEVLEMDPYRFESLVVELLVKMGYGKMQYESGATKKSGDEGIDGVVTADKLGFDSIYIQAKRFKDGPVGRPEIQKFVGALAGQGAQKGIFITTSRFTKEAEDFVSKNLNYKIVLVDGKRLADLMIEYELGVSTEYVYKVKKIDSDYFTEE